MSEASETTAVVEADGAETDDETDVDTSHLDGVEDGCGCAEVWEHLSDERDE
jgi:hypothetical protein